MCTLAMVINDMDPTATAPRSKGIFLYPDTHSPKSDYAEGLMLGAFSFLQTFW